LSLKAFFNIPHVNRV